MKLRNLLFFCLPFFFASACSGATNPGKSKDLFIVHADTVTELSKNIMFVYQDKKKVEEKVF